ncbi:hypothetical protein L226DRAFT_574279 [Lentinus tigrinus ALCF2SS1-7]|uniref:Uncharacterized protein n=1 Tax=Lentinus tigrinus ALCF2SS1-6 TaxID=1328759 RepID=A0A5C2RYW4_9APHY|nr:hypothetical protein L227DRAFT_614666 [Lentinus tigrinus ALCF2SS1-6]RPD71053.1 hypothetical protein L226DRAFT_574279 [Lentinus tigrinus ALCF2SS1-7]
MAVLTSASDDPLAVAIGELDTAQINIMVAAFAAADPQHFPEFDPPLPNIGASTSDDHPTITPETSVPLAPHSPPPSSVSTEAPPDSSTPGPDPNVPWSTIGAVQETDERTPPDGEGSVEHGAAVGSDVDTAGTEMENADPPVLDESHSLVAGRPKRTTRPPPQKDADWAGSTGKRANKRKKAAHA